MLQRASDEALKFSSPSTQLQVAATMMPKIKACVMEKDSMPQKMAMT